MAPRLDADLSARVEALFGRCPALCGFSIEAGDPIQLDLTCFPTPDTERAQLILGEVSAMLCELEEERPGSAELLRGRTFARALH